MTLQALLVSTDDSAADVLGRVLPTFGIAMDRSSDPETTIARIQQQKFEALIVDFDNAEMAENVLRQAQKLGTEPLSIATNAMQRPAPTSSIQPRISAQRARSDATSEMRVRSDDLVLEIVARLIESEAASRNSGITNMMA